MFVFPPDPKDQVRCIKLRALQQDAPPRTAAVSTNDEAQMEAAVVRAREAGSNTITRTAWRVQLSLLGVCEKHKLEMNPSATACNS